MLSSSSSSSSASRAFSSSVFIVICLLHPLIARPWKWRADDVRHEGNLHLHARCRDCHEAPRFDSTRLALDSDLRILLRIAPIRNQILAIYGFLH
ncbi:hypothetical protein SLEP1_g38688 [Rubroshorea leprosula]|uniref:Secreted protein n=1 Tax=Rubroshorea leprosula TaxID=152421 RepID=A0AAV5KY65_9ROSI|nr:hypothetical protein SLEP1_g38688 [Rubroshorea leprosula]